MATKKGVLLRFSGFRPVGSIQVDLLADKQYKWQNPHKLRKRNARVWFVSTPRIHCLPAGVLGRQRAGIRDVGPVATLRCGVLRLCGCEDGRRMFGMLRRSPAEQHRARYVIGEPERTTRLPEQFHLP